MTEEIFVEYMLIYKKNVHIKNETSILNRGWENHVSRKLCLSLNVSDGQMDIFNDRVASLLT